MTVLGSPYRRVRHRDAAGLSTPGSRHGRAAREGFTLLEILVAMVLTGFGILCFAGLLKGIGNVVAEDTWATKALLCAQERMEELRFSFATGKGFTNEGKEQVAEGPYQGMQREWAVEDSSSLSGLLEIRTGCAYPWKGSMKTVALSTLLYQED
jgi:prepilin-type N-terminal cleavage/methylation domain-containing protein